MVKRQLFYPKTPAGNERKVALSDEGFFEISKDAKKPFFVYANEIDTKVVEPSFKIKAYTNHPNVEVVVRPGKVKIGSNEIIAKPQDVLIVLLPNQDLRFVKKNLSSNKITAITQDKLLRNYTSTIEQLEFEFTAIPMSQIFKTIE